MAVPDTNRLATLENIIERGLGTFVEVGAALTEIREKRLYRDGFTSFEQYCNERWGFSKRHANRLIDAADVSAKVGPMGPLNGPPLRVVPASAPPPVPNERVARELAPLKDEPEKLRETWANVTAINPKPTAVAVREAVRRVSNSDVEFVVDDETIAEALTAAEAERVFEAVSGACALVGDLKPPREFVAMLPRPIEDYPLSQFRAAHAWLSAFLQEFK